MPLVRIRGQFRTGSPPYPTLTGVVLIPRLGKVRLTEFLVDTGADSTTLHPLDARQMGIRFHQHFAGVPMGATWGIGGSSGYWEETAEVQFLHDDLTNWDTLTLPIHIAQPTRDNSTFPSLLGRDVLQWYRVICDSRSGLLQLERAR